MIFVLTHHHQQRNHSHHHHHYQEKNRPKTLSFIHQQNNKQDHKGLHGKLKNAIKKSRSLTKKDVIDKDIDLSKYKLNHEKNKQQENALTDTKTEIQTITNDGVHLLCKNVLLQLHDKVQDSFANLENVVGVISGLDLDPVLDDFADNILMAGNTKKYNSNVIVVQGIIPKSPAGESEITIGERLLVNIIIQNASMSFCPLQH